MTALLGIAGDRSEQAADTKGGLGTTLTLAFSVLSSTPARATWGWAGWSLAPNPLSWNVHMNIQTQADR